MFGARRDPAAPTRKRKGMRIRMKRILCLCLAALLLAGMTAGAIAQPDQPTQVFVVRDTDGADDGVARLLARLAEQGIPFYRTGETPQGLFAAGDTVLLFYNCQWDRHGGTNTDLIKSVAQAVAAHPDGFTGEIIVADSGQGDGSLDHRETNSLDHTQSVQDVVDALKLAGIRITGYLWDDIMDIEVKEYSEGDDADGYVVLDGVSDETRLNVSYPKFTTEFGTKISLSRGIWDGAGYDNDRLKILNMPILKVHWLYMATGCVKAYMGSPSLNLSTKRGGSPHDSIAFGGMGEQMANTRTPTLNVMDMINISPLRGPWVAYDESVPYHAIGASIDPFALDYWAVKNVLMPEAEKMNNPNLSRIDPDGTSPGMFGYWMNLSLDALHRAGLGHDYVFGADGVEVFDR